MQHGNLLLNIGIVLNILIEDELIAEFLVRMELKNLVD